MENFTTTREALEAVQAATVQISQTKNGEAIQQAQRNKLGAALREALFHDLSAIFPATEEAGAIVAYLTGDGIVLEVPNDSVSDHLTSAVGSGAISIEIGFSIKSLEYNAKDASDAYAVDQAQKAARKAETAAKKAKAIAKAKEG